jgi:hypothetical protein
MVGFTTFSERSGEEAAFKLMRSLANLSFPKISSVQIRVMREKVRDNDAAYGQAFTNRIRNDGDSRPPDSTEIALAEPLC